MSQKLTERDLQEAINYAIRYAKRLSRQMPTVDSAEIESTAIHRAYLAWQRYDPDKGVEWMYWLRKYIEWTKSDTTRERSRARQKFKREFTTVSMSDSLSSPNGQDNSRARKLGESVSDPRGQEFERALEIRLMLEQLDPQKRQIVEQRHLEGRSQKEVGQALGLRQAQVCRLEREALEELRTLFNDDSGTEGDGEGTEHTE
jgi:RNA polymerase sigma factor (sigma-70 family)